MTKKRRALYKDKLHSLFTSIVFSYDHAYEVFVAITTLVNSVLEWLHIHWKVFRFLLFSDSVY